MSASYRYPDPGDRVTAGAIRAVGVEESELRRQETEVLGKFEKRIGTALRHSLLDYGSGEGRHSAHFADLFEYVAAYEPDDDRRASHARQLARAGQVELLATFDRVARASAFDAAICSHVIQHVARQEAEVVLGDLAAALRKGGVLLLLTTSTGLTWEDKPRFIVSQLSPAGKVVETEVSAAEFDAAYWRNTPGELPIHFYGQRELLDGLAQHGFADLQAYGLHGNAGVVGLYHADMANCRPPGGVGQDGVPLHARDVAVLATRG